MFRRKKIKLHGQNWELAHVEDEVQYLAEHGPWAHKRFEVTDAWGLRGKDGTIVATGPKPDTESLKRAMKDVADSSSFTPPDLEGAQWEKVPGGWSHDHCSVCWWTIDEHDSPESSTTGWYCDTIERWVCEECYGKLLKKRLDATQM
jgi:hypothetical protein